MKVGGWRLELGGWRLAWLIGWLVGRLAALAGWLAGWLVGWLVPALGPNRKATQGSQWAGRDSQFKDELVVPYFPPGSPVWLPS